MSKKCLHCGFEYSEFLVNHTLWCPSATSKDWPKEMIQRKRKEKRNDNR